MRNFDCNKLLKEYALSCIENYLLYLISDQEYPWQTIYCESFMPLGHILVEMYEGDDYSHFKGVKRLQEVSMEHGFSELEFVDGIVDLSEMNDAYYAVQVTNDYMREKYNFEPWRNDHHILMHNLSNQSVVEYLNDVPIDSGQMSFEEVSKICDQSAIIFHVKDCAGIDIKKAVDIAKKCVSAFEMDKLKLHFDNFTYEIARDAVSVCKVLVKRQHDFMKLFDQKFDGRDYYNYLTSVQTKLEYMRLKKCDVSEGIAIIKNVLICDKEYYEKVRDALGVN